jgi:hypothetical protein
MRALALLGLLVLAGCVEPEPLGPDATPDQLADACDAGDLDACARAARLRSDGYEAAMRLN